MRRIIGKENLIIAVVGIIVWGNALVNGFVWDDFPYLINNAQNHSIGNFWQIIGNHSFTFYRPFFSIILSGIYTIFGASAFWFHLIQISLHIGTSILIFRLFNKLFKSQLALLLTLIFIVHPMNVEAVVYISAMQTGLSVFFGLLAIEAANTVKINDIYKYSLVGLLLWLAILSKESGIIFPVVIFGFSPKKDLNKLIIPAGLAVMVFIVLAFNLAGAMKISESNKSPVPIVNASPAVKILTLPKLIFYYIKTALYPKDLAISQQWVVKTVNVKDFWEPVLGSLGLLGILGGLGIRIKNKKDFKMFLWFGLWMMMAWGTVWQIISLDMTVADRWFYLPLTGLLGMTGYLVQNINLKYLQPVAGIIIVLFSMRTMVRNNDWKNNLSLFLHDRNISKESYDIENTLSYEYLKLGKYETAKQYIDKSIQLAPGFWENWSNLGVYYINKNPADPEKGVAAFETAIKNNPNYYMGYLNLARAYFYKTTPAKTTYYLNNIALIKYPNDVFFWYLSGITEYNTGNKKTAQDAMLRAYSLSKEQKYFDLYLKIMQEN